MDNDSTRNEARLSLAERAKHGFELESHEIMALEFPTAKSYEDRQQPRYKGWQSAIEAAIEFGFLVPRKEPTTVVVPQIVSTRRFYRGALDGAPPPILQKGGSYISTRYWIDRKSYQAWRISQSNPPTGSFVHLWLGAMPGPEPTESIPVETSLPELPGPARPATVAKGGAAEKEAALLALLDEVDKRAAEQDAGFNRDSLPGTKAEFHELLNAYCPAFRYIGLPATSEYLKGKCKFRHGAQSKHGKGAAIWVLFPEYSLKLG
jgi:hypothetical protein